MAHDPKQSAKFLRSLASNKAPVITLSAIYGDERTEVPSRSFDFRDPAFFKDLSSYLAKHDDWNVYYHVNATHDATYSRKLHKYDVTTLRGCQVDIDPDKTIDFKLARDLTLDIAQSAALSQDAPTFTISSGSGAQLVYLFDKPLDATQENVDMVESMNRSLAIQFGGDPSVADISRLMRLPGTMNHMRSKSKQNRKPALAHTLTEAPTRHNPASLAITLPNDVKPARAPRSKINRASPRMMLQLKSALRSVDQEEIELVGGELDYDTWMRVGFALHAETGGSEAGFDLFDEWSQTSAKYDEEITANLWEATKNGDRDLVSGATIFHMAAEQGWSNPFKEEPLPEDEFEEDDDGLPRVCTAEFPALEESDEPASPADLVKAAKKLERLMALIPTVLTQQQVRDNPPPPPPQIVQNRIVEASIVLLVAPPNVGKTLYALYLANIIARAGSYLNTLYTQKRDVLYISTEDFQGVVRRDANLSRLYPDAAGITHADGSNLRFIDYETGKASKEAFAAVEALVKLKHEACGGTLGLVVLDVVAGCFGGNENESTHVNEFLKTFRARLVQKYGVTLLLIHHTGKDISKGGRGSSHWQAEVDSMITLSYWNVTNSKGKLKGFTEQRGEHIAADFTKMRGLPRLAAPDIFKVVSTDITDDEVARGYVKKSETDVVTMVSLEVYDGTVTGAAFTDVEEEIEDVEVRVSPSQQRFIEALTACGGSATELEIRDADAQMNADEMAKKTMQTAKAKLKKAGLILVDETGLIKLIQANQPPSEFDYSVEDESD
jgi:hypothetical protein